MAITKNKKKTNKYLNYSNFFDNSIQNVVICDGRIPLERGLLWGWGWEFALRVKGHFGLKVY